MDHRSRLRITGYGSAAQVDSIFASGLVDIAYVDEVTDDGILVIADDPQWPANAQEYDWLCSIIEEVLADRGIVGLNFSLVPAVTD